MVTMTSNMQSYFTRMALGSLAYWGPVAIALLIGSLGN
jgi:hypothetical protein